MRSNGVRWLQMGPMFCNVGVTCSPEHFHAEYKRICCEDYEDKFDCGGFVIERFRETDGYHLLMVFINYSEMRKKPYWEVAAVCAHEAAHCAQMIWKHKGERERGMEADAYLIQFLTAYFTYEFHRFGKKHGDKRKTEGSRRGKGNRKIPKRNPGQDTSGKPVSDERDTSHTTQSESDGSWWMRFKRLFRAGN